MRIESCFDSHVHWAATGEFSLRLALDGLSSPREVSTLKPAPVHWRGDWLLGFGYDDGLWAETPERTHLDAWIADKPVAFSRRDGHALWLNSEALRRAGWLGAQTQDPRGGRFVRGPGGIPSGVVLDEAARQVRDLIPPVDAFGMRGHLLKAVQAFNEAGFTHIRDMTCDELQWNEAVRLDESGLLTLAVEEYFWLKESAEIDDVIALAVHARSESPPNLRVMGVKIFLDGALGSEGAWISRCYHESENRGLQLWDGGELKEALTSAWARGLHVAVHAIGDEASHALALTAAELRQAGIAGPLHLEHAEILRPETVPLLRDLDMRVHMQPSHWLTDRNWLSRKLGGLAVHAFPWRRLQESNVAFDFGSDAPFEPPSIARTLQALTESAESGVPRLLGSPYSHMRHPDPAWAPNSFTLLANDLPEQVVFRGEHIL